MKRLTIGVNACSETLALLISVAWADGRLDDAEKAGVRAAAGQLNLPREVRALVDLMVDKPKPTSEIRFAGCSDRDKAFGYVAACWIAHADGTLDAKEEALLKTVGESIGLSEARRAELAGVAKDLGLAPPSDAGKWSDHIAALFQKALPRLEDAAVALDPSDAVEVVVE